MRLSAIVITKNEEKNIRRCLKSLRFADEIIVVDAGSTDHTAHVAQKLGAKVFVQPWPGYGPQKNFGREQARGQWLLYVDADEEVTPELAKQIEEAIATPAVDFYWLRIVTVFLGRPLTHLYGHNPRLFRKSAGRWTDEYVHEQVQTLNGQRIHVNDSLSKIMSTPLMHHSHPTIQSYLKRMRRYTTLDAEQMAKTGRHRHGQLVTPNIFLPWKLSTRQFIKMYFYRRGFLDGYAGFIWCLLSGYYEFVMSKKLNRLVSTKNSKPQ
jgi:(heptosyl)LPS beta-1,4-glucosyltransferase